MIEDEPASEIVNPKKQALIDKHPILGLLNHFEDLPRYQASYQVQQEIFTQMEEEAKAALIDQLSRKLIYYPEDLSPQDIYENVVNEFLLAQDSKLEGYLTPNRLQWFHIKARLAQVLPTDDDKKLFSVDLINLRSCFLTESIANTRRVSRFSDIVSHEIMETLTNGGDKFGVLLMNQGKSYRNPNQDPFAAFISTHPYLNNFF